MSARRILAHPPAFETLTQLAPPAPMRFGSRAEGPEVAASALRPHLGWLRAVLDKLQGHAEFALPVGWPRPAVTAAPAAKGPEARPERISLGRRIAAPLKNGFRLAGRIHEAAPTALARRMEAGEIDEDACEAEEVILLDRLDALRADGGGA